MGKNPDRSKRRLPRLSIDAWAVILSLALAALVRLGVVKHVSW
jgi:hypothetical protein